MSFVLLGILNSQAAAAAGGGPAYDLLQTQLISSNTNSVTFSSLDTLAADYKHLQIRMTLRSNFSNGFGYTQDAKLTFNGVTTTSYYTHRLEANGSSVSSGGFSQSYISLSDIVPDSDAPSNVYGLGVLDILDFASSAKNTTTRMFSGAVNTNEYDIALRSGLYISTDPITSLTLASAFGDFVSGSRLSLYGVKG